MFKKIFLLLFIVLIIISDSNAGQSGIECLYDGKNTLISGNIICNSCPCDYSLDFNADLRKCDIVFPAITSPDSTRIYRVGDYFQIR